MPRHKINQFALWAAFLLLPAANLAAKANSQGPVISRITLRSTDVFDLETNTYLRRFPYTWINALHIQTKDHVIRQELLFKVGDRYDPFIIRETERNLRALSFIRAARIRKFPQRDGTVALVVHVNDAWTTEPQLNLGGRNKVDKVEIGFKEKNLFGYGKSLQFFYNKGTNTIERNYKYTDRHLFNSDWQFTGEYTNKTTGESKEFLLKQPFISADTPRSISLSHRDSTETLGLFQNNVRVSETDQTKEANEIAYARKLNEGHAVVYHGGLRYRKESQRFERTPKSDPNRVIPESQDFQTVYLDIDRVRNKFIDLTNIEKMTRIEDFNLGPEIVLAPGFSPRALTGKRDTKQLGATYSQNWLINDLHFFMLRAEYSGRNELEHPENTRYKIDLKLYHRRFPRHTLVARTRAEWGNRLDEDNQIILGGDNGLRAFEVEQFIGTRSWLLNLEDRIFLIDEVAHLVSIGGVVFYDAGYAWPKGRAVSLSDIYSTIGTGLRFGLTKSANEVILRMDLSYRLQRIPGDPDEFVFTFGSSQAF